VLSVAYATDRAERTALPARSWAPGYCHLPSDGAFQNHEKGKPISYCHVDEELRRGPLIKTFKLDRLSRDVALWPD
jgi:hypothetical protein